MRKIAVITGASSGMGVKFVEDICSRKWEFDEIWLVARRSKPMEDLANKYKNYKFKILTLDLSLDNSYAIYEKELIKENARVKLLINNAGLGRTGAFYKIELDQQLNMIDVNIKALTAFTYISLKHMVKGSKIINMASVAGFMPQPYFNVYAATKAYVVSFSKALSVELQNRGIKVLTVCPGPVETEFFNNIDKVKAIKKLFFKKADKVVKRALDDLIKGKEISVYGFDMNVLKVLAKILPHSIIMRFMKE